MKRVTLIILAIFLVMPFANAGDLEPDYVSEKITRLAVSLVDQYVKELDGLTASFPGGQLRIELDNGVIVSFSPGLIGKGVYRTVSFTGADINGHIIILDGPVYEKPGRIKEENMLNAIKILSDHLEESGMKVVRFQKDKVEWDVSAKPDLTKLFNGMKEEIDIEEDPTMPTSIVLDPDLPIIVDPIDDDNKTIGMSKQGRMRNIPSWLRRGERARTTISFSGTPKNVDVEIDEKDSISRFNMNGNKVTTSKAVELRNKKMYLKTKRGSRIVGALPSVSSEELEISETVLDEDEEGNAVYDIEGKKKVKFLAIIPVSMRVKARVNAENGEAISVSRPWWGFLTSS